MSKCKKTPYDFTIFQGDDHGFGVTYKNADGTPKNLTGYTARMQGRADYDSEDTVFDLTLGSGLALTPLSGRFDVSLGNVITAQIPPGIYVYDLELTSPAGLKEKLIFGKITVLAEVTKA